FMIAADAGASLTIQPSSVITASSALTWGGAGTITVNAALTGAATQNKQGSGTLIFGGNNTFTGAVTVSAGTLKLASATALGATTSVTVAAGGTLDVNGYNTDRGLAISGTGVGGGGALINSGIGSTSTLTGTAALSAASVVGGAGNITISNATGLTGNVLLNKVGGGTLTFITTAASARTGAHQIDAGTLRLQAATVLAATGTGAMALNGGTLSLGYNATGALTNVVNVLSDGAIITDRATSGDGGIVLTMGALTIGGSKLTVKAGDNVGNGTIGLTLGAVTIGGASMLPGNPTFDVQSTAAAATTLTLGSLSDQAIAPRTITFQNSGTAASSVTLATAATSLVNGTLINLAGTGGPLTLNLNIASALGTLAQVTVGNGKTLNLGAAQTVASLAGSGNVAGAFVLTVGNANTGSALSTVYSGVLGFGGSATGLTKAGFGTLTLSGANAYTGATIISAGILELGSATALGATSGVTISAGGTLDLNGQTTDRNLTSVSGTGINSGGAIINSSLTPGGITGNVALAAVASLGGAGDIIISNTTGVTGNVQLTKIGAGTLTIIDTTTTSARTGANRIEEGTLRLESAALTAVSPLGTSGAWTLNGGTLSLGFDTANALMTGAVTLTNNATVITDVATLGNAAVTHTMGALTMAGNTLTVRTGGNVAADGTQGMTFGAVTLNGDAAFDVQNSATATTRLTLGAFSDLAIAPRTITFGNTGAATAGNIVTLATAAGSLVDGTVVNINGGTNAGVTVNMNVVGALGSLSQVNVKGNSTLTTGITSVVLGSLGGNGTVNASGAFTLIVGNANSSSALDSTFSGVLANGTGTLALTKAGLGTLTLSGAAANTYTGLTTVNAGTLVLGKTGGALAMSGGLTIGASAAGTAGNATVRLEGNDQLSTTAPLLMNAGSTLNLNGYNLTVLTFSTAFGSTVTGAGTLAIGNTGGTLTFTGSSSISSNLQLTTGISATRTMAVTNVTDLMHISGNVSQGSTNGAIVAGNSAQTALGTLILSGNNTYTGTTTVSSGILNIRSGAALGTITSGTSVTAGGTLQIQGGITTLAEALTVSGAGFVGSNGINLQTGAFVNVSGTNNYAGLVA
ncbi:MAG TPA: autotransporter-associated beta strand repeat-containing protein, partial [Prosthecobacter sp.]|nr:autotransporter-associated beta strand repeat-containing protein [Prosthecobacter sp.]